MDTEEKVHPGFYTVAVTHVTREYGGPEEGGWYYNHYVPVEGVIEESGVTISPIITRDEKRAIDDCRKMQQLLDATINKDLRPLSSVLSTGRYHAQVFDGYPKEEPAERPHYE